MAVVGVPFEAGDADALPGGVVLRDQGIERLDDFPEFAQVPVVPLEALAMRIGRGAQPLGVSGEVGMDVLDAPGTKRRRKSRPREPGLVAPGSLTDIDEHVNAGLAKKAHEVINVSLLVAEREERCGAGGSHRRLDERLGEGVSQGGGSYADLGDTITQGEAQTRGSVVSTQRGATALYGHENCAAHRRRAQP